MLDKPTRLSAEKCAEMEFSIFTDENKARTEFNRRVQTLQFGLIGASIAAFAALKVEVETPGLLLTIAGILGSLTVSLFLETNQNNLHIALAWAYVGQAFNKRYLGPDGRPAIQWELFIQAKRNSSSRVSTRLAFYLDAQAFTNIILMGAAVAMYVIGLRETPPSRWLLGAITGFWLVLDLLLFFYCLDRHFNEPRAAFRNMTLRERRLFDASRMPQPRTKKVAEAAAGAPDHEH